jgi:hypothetical protein
MVLVNEMQGDVICNVFNLSISLHTSNRPSGVDGLGLTGCEKEI